MKELLLIDGIHLVKELKKEYWSKLESAKMVEKLEENGTKILLPSCSASGLPINKISAFKSVRALNVLPS